MFDDGRLLVAGGLALLVGAGIVRGSRGVLQVGLVPGTLTHHSAGPQEVNTVLEAVAKFPGAREWTAHILKPLRDSDAQRIAFELPEQDAMELSWKLKEFLDRELPPNLRGNKRPMVEVNNDMELLVSWSSWNMAGRMVSGAPRYRTDLFRAEQR